MRKIIIIFVIFLTGVFVGQFNPRIVEKPVEVVKYIGVNPASEERPELTYLGIFNSSAYDACYDCCGKTDGITATGTRATPKRTIAVDPTVIPYGSEVIINGQTYIAEDTGGAIKGKRVDIFFDTHEEALNYGRRNVEVFIKRGD